MKKFFLLLLLLLSLVTPFETYADVTDTISVSASVNPHPSDFQLSFASSPDAATTVNQFQNIVYTITYGSHLSYSAGMTITASWDQGTIQGQSSPSVDIADYVLGSATNAYNSTPPVIDTVNKRITWTIASLPANTTDQTVSFTLQTNDSYTGSQTVTFPTVAQITVSGTTVPEQTITMTYQYNPAVTPTPTPSPTMTPTPTLTSTPTPTQTQTPSSAAPTPTSSGYSTNPTPSTGSEPTATPTEVPTVPLTITGVSVETISPSSASIHVTTNIQAAMKIIYGTSPTSLTQSSNAVTGIDQLIDLTNLSPHTQYYFRVIANSGTETVTSEIFTFLTASAPPTAEVDKSSLIVTSGTTLLYSVVENMNGQLHETIVLPVNKPFQFTFSLAGNNIKKVIAFVRNNHVLGENTFDQKPPETNIKLFEIQPHVYQGLLTSSKTPGTYGLYIHIYDANGNISEKQLFSIKVIRPLTILSNQTKKAIEQAQATLYRLDITTKKFVKITPQMFAIQNPSFSDIQGEVPFVLPQGRYQVVVDSLGYAEKTVTFTIGPARDQDYPIVYLDKAGFSLTNIQQTVGAIISQFTTAGSIFLSSIGNSKQFAFAIAALILILFVLLSVFSLCLRLHTKIFLLPALLWHKISRHIFPNKQKVFGRVMDDVHDFPLHHAEVVIINADTNTIIAERKTNAAGEFSFTPDKGNQYNIFVEKYGYEQHPFFPFTKESLKPGTILLPIHKEEQAVSIGMYVKYWFAELLSLSLEVILVTTFLLEVLFAFYLGSSIILPFLLLSVLNIVILITILH